MHPLLNRAAAPLDFSESVQPRTQAAARRIEPELIARPSADGSGNQNAEDVELPKRRHEDRPDVYNFALNGSGSKNSQVRKNIHGR
jgi:hypothetical protein